jgi:hypothetical protein
MKRVAALILLLGACSQRNEPEAGNIAQPIEQAKADAAARAPIANESVGAPPESAANASIPPSPHADADAPPLPSEKTALGAARRLQEYCDAVATRRLRDAYGYWGNSGQASGMTFAQFRDSFAKYAAYDCHIGQPGDMEGAAGSAYVTIPLKVTGTLAKGGGFVLEGPVTMRRVNDIDGSTAEQRRWHIESSGLKPRP